MKRKINISLFAVRSSLILILGLFITLESAFAQKGDPTKDPTVVSIKIRNIDYFTSGVTSNEIDTVSSVGAKRGQYDVLGLPQGKYGDARFDLINQSKLMAECKPLLVAKQTTQGAFFANGVSPISRQFQPNLLLVGTAVVNVNEDFSPPLLEVSFVKLTSCSFGAAYK